MTADHHLFDKQVESFERECNIFVWDAPGHAASRPFELTFSLMDKAGIDYRIGKQSVPETADTSLWEEELF